jgi:hypothetical protein
MASGGALCLGVLGGSNGLNDEGHQHARARREEQRTTTNLVDKETDADGRDELHDGEITIDLQLGLVVCDSNGLEHSGEIVRDQGVSRPLGEQAKADKDEETVAVTGS